MFSTRSLTWVLDMCATKWLLLSPSMTTKHTAKLLVASGYLLSTCSGQALFSITGHTAQITRKPGPEVRYGPCLWQLKYLYQMKHHHSS